MPNKSRLNHDEKLLTDFLLQNISSQRIDSIDQSYTGYLHPPILNYWAPSNVLSDFKLLSACKNLIGENATMKNCDTLVQSLIIKLVQIVIPHGLNWDCLITYLEESHTHAINEAIHHCVQQIQVKRRFYIPLNATGDFHWSGQNFSIIGAETFIAQANHNLDVLDELNEESLFLSIDACDIEEARDIEETILGAIALAMHPTCRYKITFSNKHTYWFMDNGGYHKTNRYKSHMPSVETFELSAADTKWLIRLDEIVLDRKKEPKKSNALRLLFQSWDVSELQRFSMLCSSVEALMPQSCKGYAAKCEWIERKLNGVYNEDAIQLLFKKLRSDVAHGDIANLEQSDHYLNFVRAFKLSPSDAQEQLVMRILEYEIFEGTVRYQNHPLTKKKSNKTALDNYVRIFGNPIQYTSHPISDYLLKQAL